MPKDTRKAQIVATLPDHVVTRIIAHAETMDVTKSEYLALIAKWWFSQDCPPVSDEEKLLRAAAAQLGANERPHSIQVRRKR